MPSTIEGAFRFRFFFGDCNVLKVIGGICILFLECGVCLVGVCLVGVCLVGVCLVGVCLVGVWRVAASGVRVGVEGRAAPLSPVFIPPFKLSLKCLYLFVFFLFIIFFLCVFLFRNNDFFIINSYIHIHVYIYF